LQKQGRQQKIRGGEKKGQSAGKTFPLENRVQKRLLGKVREKGEKRTIQNSRIHKNCRRIIGEEGGGDASRVAAKGKSTRERKKTRDAPPILGETKRNRRKNRRKTDHTQLEECKDAVQAQFPC